jgi:hypothetical protein
MEYTPEAGRKQFGARAKLCSLGPVPADCGGPFIHIASDGERPALLVSDKEPHEELRVVHNHLGI